MMLEKGQRLLLPVNPWFILGSVLLALLLTLVPAGHALWAPDLLLLVLAFWCLHQPRYVGVGAAFVAGVIMDVHHGTLLGLYGFAYATMAFLMSWGQRRMLWFSAWMQLPQLIGILLLTHALVWVLRLASGGRFPGWELLWAPAIETLCWPLISYFLLLPQRRAPDRDLTRPL